MLTSLLNRENLQPTYFNVPQIKSMLVGAPEETAVWARGTGKSSGLISPRSYEWCHRMPRGTMVFVAATYQQHLTRTLPSIVMGWERIGFKRDRDFFIGHYAPKKWKWETPYQAPIRSEFFIHTRFGSGIQLVSQDRPGSANGISIDAIAGDEAKFLRQDRFEQELLPAMRGNRRFFGELDCWNSILLTTDMPTSESGNWLLEKQKNNDPKRVEIILKLQMRIQKRLLKIQSGKCTKSQINTLHIRNQGDRKKISKLRMGNPLAGIPRLSYFNEATSYDNKDVLGDEYFENMRNNMSDFLFDTQIKNLRIRRDGQTFYPHLSDRVHGYTAFDNSYLDSRGYNLEYEPDITCLQDQDLSPDSVLHIGMDYGGSFNCLVVGLPFQDLVRFINCFHVKYPKKIKHVVAKFKQYYRHHQRKEVVLYYDHTATGTSAAVDFDYHEEAVECLLNDDEYGSWHVKSVFIGHTPTPTKRYELWEEMTSGNHEKAFQYNRHHCDQWYISCTLAPMRDTGKGIEKVKTSEKKKPGVREYRVPQEEATHYSDAGDTLLIGMIEHAPEERSSGFVMFN